MQIAPNPLPHRAVECFVAHPERGGARWVARAAVGTSSSFATTGSRARERRRIDPGQHRATVVPLRSAAMRTGTCSRERPRFFALPPRRRALRPSLDEAVDPLSPGPRRRQKPGAHRHVKATPRNSHALSRCSPFSAEPRAIGPFCGGQADENASPSRPDRPRLLAPGPPPRTISRICSSPTPITRLLVSFSSRTWTQQPSTTPFHTILE